MVQPSSQRLRSAIAARLQVSAWMVQDHLEAIFEEGGVGTRVDFHRSAPQLPLV